MIRRWKKAFELPHILWWMPAVAILGFFYPILFGDMLLSGVAHGISEDLPMHLWFAEAMRSGAWAINPFYFGGVPSYLSQTDMLHPVSFVFYKLLKPLTAYYWIIALSFLGQWYSFYLLSRKLNMSQLAAVFASFVWIFNQWNIQWGGLEAIGVFLATVPLIPFLIIKINEGKRVWLYALLAVAVLAPNWVFSLTQTTLYLAAAMMAFALFLDFQKKGLNLAGYKTTLIWLAIIFVSLAAVFPIIKADYAIHSISFRSGGLSHEETLKDYYNGFDLIHFVSPFTVLPFLNTEYTHFYMGILPILLVILAWQKRSENIYVKFFFWLAILALIAAVKYSPIFFVLSKLPAFNLFRGSGKILFLTTFSLAVLAGYGLDALRRAEGLAVFSRVARLYKRLLIALSVIIVAANLLYYFAFDLLSRIGFRIFMRFGYDHTLRKEPTYYFDKVTALLGSWFRELSFSNTELWLAIITLALTGVLVALLTKGKLAVGTFSILAILLTYGSSLMIWHKYYQFIPASVLDKTPTVQFLLEHLDYRYRALTFNIGLESYKDMGLKYDDPRERYQFEAATLVSDLGMIYGIETLNGHEAFLTLRQQFISEFNSQFATQKITLDQKKDLFQSKIPLLSMMNVKYVVSSLPLDAPFVKRFESDIVGTRIPLYMYENPNALPRIYFATSSAYIPEDLLDSELRNKIDEIRDFGEKTLIECDDCAAAVGSSGKVALKSYKADDIQLGSENKGDQWLVLSNSYLPGWRAFIDGKETKIYRANYLFQAIKVPAGKREIVFKYKII